jgi:hypothetical protein
MWPVSAAGGINVERDQKFESTSLQRRVRCELDFLDVVAMEAALVFLMTLYLHIRRSRPLLGGRWRRRRPNYRGSLIRRINSLMTRFNPC